MKTWTVKCVLLLSSLLFQNQTVIKKDTLDNVPDNKNTVVSATPETTAVIKKAPEKDNFSNAYWILQNGATSGPVYSFAFDSSNLYAATYGGVFNSKDSGKTWQLVNAEHSGVRSLGKIMITGSDLEAISNNYNYCYGGAYLSSDGGKSWSVGGCCTSWAYKYDSAILVGNTVFMGNEKGAFYWDSIEKIWKPVRGGLTNEINSSIHALVSFCGDIYASSVNGVFVSRDDGKSWEDMNTGLPEGHHIDNLAVKDTFLFAGGIRVFRKSINEKSWSVVAKGIPGAEEEVVVSNGNIIRVAAPIETEGSKFWKTFLSTNNGNTWKEIPMVWPYARDFGQLNLMASGSDTYLLVTDGYDEVLYHSKDGGKSWSIIKKEDLQYYSALISDGKILYGGYNLTCDGGSCGKVWIGNSFDNGRSWSISDSGLPNDISVTSFALLGSVVFAGTFPKDSYTIEYDEARSDCSDGGIFYSKDKGKSWKNINNGLPPGIRITTLLVHKNELYAGTDFGAIFKLASGK